MSKQDSSDPRFALDLTVTDLNGNTVAEHIREVKLMQKYIQEGMSQNDIQKVFGMNIQKVDTDPNVIDLLLNSGAVVRPCDLHIAWSNRDQNPDLLDKLSKYVEAKGIKFSPTDSATYENLDHPFMLYVNQLTGPASGMLLKGSPKA